MTKLIRSRRLTWLKVACLVVGGSCACTAEVEDASPRNVDPDGIYGFGTEEKWILAQNSENEYSGTDMWTNSLGETLFIVPLADLTHGETAESEARYEEDGWVRLGGEPSIPAQAVPGAPGWWWWADSKGTTTYYEGWFVHAPRGFDTEVSRDGTDIGRARAAAIFNSLKFL